MSKLFFFFMLFFSVSSYGNEIFYGPCKISFENNSSKSIVATTTYYSLIDGIYELPIWSTVSHVGAPCICTPGCTVGANSVIRISHDITSSCAALNLGSNVTFIVEAGGQFTLTGNGAITGTGSIEIQPGGVMEVHGDITLNGAGAATVNGTLNVFGSLTDLNGGGSVCGSGNINVTTPPGAGTICGGFSGTLPVELVSFTGKTVSSHANLLEWETVTEVNNKYFSLERSNDGENFYILININGAGNSSISKKYSFSDEQISSKLNYYRLKQVDYDGNFKYSSIITVETKTSDLDIKVYPIPSAGDVFVRIPEGFSNAKNISVKVVDLFGKEIFASDLEYANKEMEVNFVLSKGYYNVIVESGNKKHTKKLTVH